MRITARIETTVAKVLACVTSAAMIAATAACGIGGANPSPSPATDSPSQQDSPVSVVAAENTWGSIAAQLAGDAATVTSIVSDTSTDMSTFAPNSDQKAAISNAQIVIVTGAGYDSWASDLTQQGQSVINAAATIGAGTGDNPYLWMSSDARGAVAKAIADSLTKLRPGHSEAFASNLDAWQDAEDEAEKAVEDFGKSHDGLRYAATTPVAYYLMSEADIADSTPQEWNSAAAKDTTPDTTATAQFSIVLKDGVGLLITDPQRSNSSIDSVLRTADLAHVPTVSIAETMPASEESLPQWIEDIVADMTAALEQASASAATSSSTDASASATAETSASASASSPAATD